MSDINLTLSNCNWLNLSELKDSSILVTGGTGLIGYNILNELSEICDAYNIKLFALVRNIEKSIERFDLFKDKVNLICGDILNLPTINEDIDYIIHGASVTASKFFVENPVKTILTAFTGTKNLLDLAVAKHVKSFVYLSSMEVYGTVAEKVLLSEDRLGYINPLSVRSSYSESKRMCENLCISYVSEYGVNVKIARLAQTFGPGIPKDDKRVFVHFLNKALKNEIIEIKSSGKSARMYAYTFDAVTAIISILLQGDNGSAYNIANKNTYCSILQLANVISDNFGNGCIVKTNMGSEEEKRFYPPDSFLFLDTKKLESLGWKPFYNLVDGLRLLAESLEDK